ncbi:MAG TPA: bifunctional hydroxymethylpyrimidine kinase/phosphomethylpyrimidine kinase [Leptolyngbyaceae cyanobacterium M65_K2018_010]|nr:bifunctional hydroxymethylpyrimidine kinase/phosphomethylpyrimidine kinase [Leptolyngbyaceae cyanobacterium M65_K2018_010]
MTLVSPWPVALTIAGSDSGGGAGIQADLKTFAFQRVHGATALTCVTAQNTVGVSRVDALPPEAVVAQLEAVFGDLTVAAVKTGMLLNQPIIGAVAEFWGQLPQGIPLVVDPVMVSRAGAQLIDDAAIATLTEALLPQADILTPNRYEAQLLTGLTLETLADMEAAARKIHQLGPKAVLVKGGAMAADLKGTDLWFDGHEVAVLTAETIDTPHTHGTGCTLSAAIAANLALGQAPLAAVQTAKAYVTQALQHALNLGRGQGPVGHFFPLLA